MKYRYDYDIEMVVSVILTKKKNQVNLLFLVLPKHSP